MDRKTLDGKILSRAELKFLEEKVKEAFGLAVWQYVEAQNFDVKAHIAFLAVSHRCREAREAHGLSIKEAAAVLKVPQYRVRQIEEGSIEQLDYEILQNYIDYLGLKRWYARWRAAQAPKKGNSPVMRNRRWRERANKRLQRTATRAIILADSRFRRAGRRRWCAREVWRRRNQRDVNSQGRNLLMQSSR